MGSRNIVKAALVWRGFHYDKVAMKAGVGTRAVEFYISGSSNSKRVEEAIQDLVGKEIEHLQQFKEN